MSDATRRVKIDLDGALPAEYGERLEWIMHVLKWPVRCVAYRRTRRGWHVEIHLARAVHPWRIVAAQAVLGSDYRREAFNLRRVANWRRLPDVARDRWNVLFTRKYVYPNERKKQNATD